MGLETGIIPPYKWLKRILESVCKSGEGESGERKKRERSG